MIIIWKEDGTLKEFVNNEAVNQHSNKVNRIQFAFENKSASEYTGDTIFTLKNNDSIVKVATPKYFMHKGIEYQGFEVFITDDVTLFNGNVDVVCRIFKNENILYTYQFKINVNASTPRSFSTNQLQVNQYEQLLGLLSNYAERYDINFIRKYNSLELAQNDTEIGNGAVVLVLNNGEFQLFKKESGTFNEVPFKDFEDLVKATPTSIRTDFGKTGIGLFHDNELISGQTLLHFKTINGENIFGNGNISTFKVISILGHTGTFTESEKEVLQHQCLIKDLDSGMYYQRVTNKLYSSVALDTNGTIRIWFIKIGDNFTWEITSQTLANKGDIYEPKKVTLKNAQEEATNGSLTEDEYLTLTTDTTAYIYFNKEKYNLADNMHNTGSMTYTHLGYENNVFMLKAITITLNNKTWILNEKEI